MKYLSWAFERILFWLMWCLVANCRVGRMEGFREESLILDLSVLEESWLRVGGIVNLLFSAEF